MIGLLKALHILVDTLRRMGRQPVQTELRFKQT